MDNENRGQIKVYLSVVYKMPNYMECDEAYEDEPKIRFKINPDHPAKAVYFGVCSRYGQPISIKPIYGEFVVAKQKKRGLAFSHRNLLEILPKKSKSDIFEKANQRLFHKMGEEDRADLIHSIMRKKHRKIYELSKGKDYININKVQTNLFRVSNLKRKYVGILVLFCFTEGPPR